MSQFPDSGSFLQHLLTVRRERKRELGPPTPIGSVISYAPRRLPGVNVTARLLQHYCFFPPICTSKPSGSCTWKLPSVTRIFSPRRFSSASTAGLTDLSASQLASVYAM